MFYAVGINKRNHTLYQIPTAFIITLFKQDLNSTKGHEIISLLLILLFIRVTSLVYPCSINFL